MTQAEEQYEVTEDLTFDILRLLGQIGRVIVSEYAECRYLNIFSSICINSVCYKDINPFLLHFLHIFFLVFFSPLHSVFRDFFKHKIYTKSLHFCYNI